ncbi:MAG TPA: TolC family protein [Anaeromyxobacteraceae bacterium]|nr:TolC family protein [Anaeromyxobacteraceae bacterium]
MARLTVHRAAPLLLALASAGGARAATPPPAELLTLDRAVELALQHNQGVRAAALAVDRGDETIAAARTRYLPALSLEATAGQLLMPVEVQFAKGSFGTIPNVGPVPDRDTTVKSGQNPTFSVTSKLEQPLTQLYTAREGVRLAETGRDADRAQLQIQCASVVAEVKRSYHQILASRTALAAAQEQLAARRELSRTAARLVVEQAALRSDELEARSGVAAASLQVHALEDGLATAREQMNRLLGRDLATPFEVVALRAAAPEELDLEAARARALRERPDLRQARLMVEKADAERRMKAWEYVPQVSAGVSYSSTFNVETLPSHIAIAGLFLKWEGLDWGRRGSEGREKSLAVEEARLKVKDAEAAALVEVGDRFRKLQQAREQVEAARLSHEALRAKAPVLLNRLRLEAALLKDALAVQAALTQAASDHQQALAALGSAQADFEKALGMAP